MESLTTFAALLFAAVLLVPLFKRAGLGTVLGYLAVGIIIGPWGIKLVQDPDNLLHTAELGVTLLLFIIGLELQPSRLWALKKKVFGLGALHVFGTGGAIGGIALLMGLDQVDALLIGLTLALSSTAFVLPTLAERKELTTRFGRNTFAILLFQDLMVIPLLALLPLLGAPTEGEGLPPSVGLGVLLLVAVVGRPLLNRLFRYVAKVNSREMFTAATLATALGLALLMAGVGLSMSLGAFVAGVLLSDSEFRHELEVAIAPFQGLLLGLFFIAVGMSANLGLLADTPFTILGVTLGLLIVKGGVFYLLRRITQASVQVARGEALMLAQGGEFAFVLFGAAMQGHLLDQVVAERLMLSVALSMALAPVLLILGDRISRREAAAEPEKSFDTMPEEATPVVIAGFGRVGQIVGRLLLARGIPFTAVDSDPAQIETVRRFGQRVFYGDASRLELIHSVQLGEAKIFVLAIDDVKASLRVAELVRKHYPDVSIIARARNRFHAMRLMDLGVDLLERETLLSSLELARFTLEALGDPPELAEQMVKRFAQHDVTFLKRQHAIYHDEQQLIQSANEARSELVSILEQEKVEFSKRGLES